MPLLATHRSSSQRSAARTQDFTQRQQRKIVKLWVQIQQPADGIEMTAMVTNLSIGGCKIECFAPIVRRHPVSIRFEDGTRRTGTVMWSKTGAYGCKLSKPLAPEEFDDLVSAE